MLFYDHFRLMEALKVGCYSIRFARIEPRWWVKTPPPLVVIGTIWSDFGDFGEIFSKVQKWYLEVSIDLFIDSNHLKKFDFDFEHSKCF